MPGRLNDDRDRAHKPGVYYRVIIARRRSPSARTAGVGERRGYGGRSRTARELLIVADQIDTNARRPAISDAHCIIFLKNNRGIKRNDVRRSLIRSHTCRGVTVMKKMRGTVPRISGGVSLP